MHTGPVTSLEVSIILPKQIEDDDLLETILRPPCVTCDRKPRALDKEAVEREAFEFRAKAWHLLLDNLDVVLLLKQGNDVSRVCDIHLGRLAFHLSISSCCLLYCLTNSSNTFFKPSEFVCNAGVTSWTVLSTSTPFIIRKHLRSGGSGPRVSRTSL